MSNMIKKALWTTALTAATLFGTVFNADAQQKKAPVKKAPAPTTNVDTIYLKKTHPSQKNHRVKIDCGTLLIIFNATGKAPVVAKKPVTPKAKPCPDVVKKTPPVVVKKAPPVVKKAPPVVVKKAPPVVKKAAPPVVVTKSTPAPTVERTPVLVGSPAPTITADTTKATPIDTASSIKADTTNTVKLTPPAQTDTTKKELPIITIEPVSHPVVQSPAPILEEKKQSKLSVVITGASIHTKSGYNVVTTKEVPFHLQKPPGYTGPWSYPATVQVSDTTSKKFKNFTPGIGLEWRFNQAVHAAGGFQQNALGKGSFYVNAGAETNGKKFLGLGGAVGAATGYGRPLTPVGEAYLRLGQRDNLINGKIGVTAPISTPTIKIPTAVQLQLRVKLFSQQKQYQHKR